MRTAARQVVEDRCQDPKLQEGGQPLPLGSTVCAASQEELGEVKYESLHQPGVILMVAESATSDSDSSSSDSSGEMEMLQLLWPTSTDRWCLHRLRPRKQQRPCTSIRDLALSIVGAESYFGALKFATVTDSFVVFPSCPFPFVLFSCLRRCCLLPIRFARSENIGCNQSFFPSVNDVTTLLLHPSGCASQCSGSIKFTWAAF